jgi:branched-subunit amino acid transport protein
MTNFEVWVVILGLTFVTFITRGFFLLMGTKIELPDVVQRAVRYAPAAALVAIIIPEVFFGPGHTHFKHFDWYTPQLWGGLAAVLGFLISKSMVFTILLGMLVFGCLRLTF